MTLTDEQLEVLSREPLAVARAFMWKLKDGGVSLGEGQVLRIIGKLADALLARRRDRARCKRLLAIGKKLRLQRNLARCGREDERSRADWNVEQLHRTLKQRDEYAGQLAEVRGISDVIDKWLNDGTELYGHPAYESIAKLAAVLKGE